MKSIIIVIMSIVPILCCGQIDINKAFEALQQAKSETSIVKSSVSADLLIIRQQYRLSRDGKTYGRNNKPYYGETYSLGIKISNGLLLQSTVIAPWENDEDYNRLNTSNQYRPELFWSFQRPLEKAEYSVVDLELDTEYTHPLDQKGSIYVHKEKKGDFGLSVDETPGDKLGYMVWIHSNTNLQDSTMSVAFKQNTMSLVASEDSAYIALDVNDTENILGGLFVVPKFERGGRIQLLIVGVATQCEKENKWYLTLLTKGRVEKNKNSTASEVDEKGGSSEPTLIESPKDVPDKKRKKKRE